VPGPATAWLERAEDAGMRASPGKVTTTVGKLGWADSRSAKGHGHAHSPAGQRNAQFCRFVVPLQL